VATSSLDAITDSAADNVDHFTMKTTKELDVPIEGEWKGFADFEGFCHNTLGAPKEACTSKSAGGGKNSVGTLRNIYLFCPPKTEDTESCVIQERLEAKDDDKHTLTYKMLKSGPLGGNLKEYVATVTVESKGASKIEVTIEAQVGYLSTCKGEGCDDKAPDPEMVKAKKAFPWGTKAGFKGMMLGMYTQWIDKIAKMATE